MGLFDNKDNTLERHIERLERDNERLSKQIERLQEALIAKESPEAYRQFKADEANLRGESGFSAEKKKQIEEEMEFTRQYVAEIEKPFFSDGDDMVSKLGAIIGVPESPSIHDNEES